MVVSWGGEWLGVVCIGFGIGVWCCVVSSVV